MSDLPPDVLQPARGDLPLPGDILLFFRARGLNLFITAVTGSPYYHAAIYAGKGTVVEAKTRGVMHNDLRLLRPGHAYVVAKPPEGAGEPALQWALTKVGDGYDNVDIVVITLEHVFNRLKINYTPRGKFTCGEFVACALEAAGVPTINGKRPAEVDPGDLAVLLPNDLASP